MPMCPKCNKKKRVYEEKKKVKGRLYWIERCVSCKTPLSMEEIDDKPFKLNS